VRFFAIYIQTIIASLSGKNLKNILKLLHYLQKMQENLDETGYLKIVGMFDFLSFYEIQICHIHIF